MAANARKGKERDSREVRERDQLKNQGVCQFCGCGELSVPCLGEACAKATHQWCYGLFSQGQGKMPLCKYHVCAAERLPMVPLRALLGLLAREEVQLPVELRGKSGILYIEGCYGVVFWDYIGQLYFPQRAQWGKTREILEFSGELAESWEPRQQKSKAPYIEEELNYTLQQLTALYEFLDCTKADLCRAVSLRARKATEYLKSLPSYPSPKPYNSRQYLLDEASLSYHFPLYDQYSNYILSSHLTPTYEDLPKVPSLCMVCAATEHTETNVLVICSVSDQPGLRGVRASRVLWTAAST